jgi:O-antigen/teichoic acid export membrane protein
VNEPSIRDRVLKGAALNLIAVVFNQGSTLLVNIAVARLLLKEAFGEYAIIQGTLLTAGALSQLSTGYTASKYIAEYRRSDPARAGRVMGLCATIAGMTAIAGALLLVLAAPWIAQTVLNNPSLAPLLMIGSVFVFFSAMNGYQLGALSGFEAYDALARAGIASGLVALIVISGGAWLGGLHGAILGLGISAIIRFAIHLVWLKSESCDRGIAATYGRALVQEKSVVLRFALPAAITAYFSLPMIWLGNSFLVRQPGGYAEMAVYAAASNLRMLVLFLPQVLNTVSLTVLNNVKGHCDPKKYQMLYRNNVLTILVLTLMVAGLASFIAPPALKVFGKDFMAGTMVLQVLLCSTVFEGLSIALYQHLQAQEKLWSTLFWITAPREGLFFVLAMILTPTKGALGLAIAYASSWMVAMIAIAFLIHRERATTGQIYGSGAVRSVAEA